MKDYMKSNPFLSFVIIAMWIFFLGLSIAEKGFFIKHITEPIGTTVFFIGIGTVITTNREKIKNKKEINQEETLNIEKNSDNSKKSKKSVSKDSSFKKFMIVILSIASIITTVIFAIYKPEFSVTLFLWTILFCCLGEICVAGPFALIIKIAMDYRKDCKEQGMLKATMVLIIFLIIFILLFHNKLAELFK